MPIDPSAGAPPRRLLRGSQHLAILVGRRLLVGITYLRSSGEVAGTQQFCGEVLDVAEGVVVVDHPGHPEPAVLPADDLAYWAAPPGQYRLNTTGEVVTDPDWLTTWTVHENAPPQPGPPPRGV